MGITSRVSLGLEKSIEIPEGAFDVAVGLHLFEAHFDEDLDELLSSFHEKMKVSILNIESFSIRIELLELMFFPRSISKHSTC